MLRRKTQLVVPIRDRRQHVRILTIRNFLCAVLVAAVAFGAIEVISEMRAPSGSGYGRLFSQQAPDEKITPKPAPQVVTEAPVGVPVADADRADPTLLVPAARSQYLGDAQVHVTPVNTAQAIDVPQPAAGDRAKVQIVGGSDGVSIVHGSGAQTPKLSGGIFRN